MSVSKTYKSFWQQGFIPIFVKDDFSTENLLEGCLKAGLKVIEYTLRRDDSISVIPEIKANYPFRVIVGSVLDCDKIVKKLKDRSRNIMTLSELSKQNIDGFISMFEYSPETFSKYSRSHMLIPCAYTPNEAYRQMKQGAHMIKIVSDVELVKQCRSAPGHNFCPIFFTGGATIEKIPEIVAAGAVCVASGFDLILKGKERDISSDDIAVILKNYVKAVNESRWEKYPELMDKINSGENNWLEFLPHYK